MPKLQSSDEVFEIERLTIMLLDNYIDNAKALTLIFVVVVLTACGGGRATTSSNESPTNEPPLNKPPVNNIGSATLNWMPPTRYTDDTVITKLSGHSIYVNDGNGYTKVVSINNPSVTTYIVENLAPGTYTFVVTAFDSQDMESAYSSGANITISL